MNSAGTRTVNLLPLPTSLSTPMVPPSNSANFLRNRQPQSSALLDAALGPFGLTVFVEDGGELLRWNTFSGVRYRDDENRDPGTHLRRGFGGQAGDRRTNRVFLLPSHFEQ